MAEQKITRAQIEMIFARRFRDVDAVPVAGANFNMSINLKPEPVAIERSKSKRDARFSVEINFQPFPKKGDPSGYADYFTAADIVRENGTIKYFTLAQVVEMLVRSGVGFSQVSIYIQGTQAMAARYSVAKQQSAVDRFEQSSPAKISQEKQKMIDYLATVRPGAAVIPRVQERIAVCDLLLTMDANVRSWLS
jgi:hypothetical protein